MASEHIYEIRIKYDVDDDDERGEAPITGNNEPNSGKKKPSATGTALQIITPFINTAMTQHSQYISTVTGSAQLAKRTALENAAISGTLDLVKGAVTGGSVAAMLGLAFGPAALVGVAMSAVTKVLDIATNIADISNKMQVEAPSISATRARAGLSWDMSRRK